MGPKWGSLETWTRVTGENTVVLIILVFKQFTGTLFRVGQVDVWAQVDVTNSLWFNWGIADSLLKGKGSRNTKERKPNSQRGYNTVTGRHCSQTADRVFDKWRERSASVSSRKTSSTTWSGVLPYGAKDSSTNTGELAGSLCCRWLKSNCLGGLDDKWQLCRWGGDKTSGGPASPALMKT